MATITQRESGKWEARVRKRGGRAVSKTFSTKSLALAWAREQEAQMERGTWLDTTVAHRTTVAELLGDYRTSVANSRGSPAELGRLERFSEELGHYRMDALTPAVLLKWRDERLKAVAPGTVARELGLLGGVVTWARKERLIPLPQNPVSAIALPAVDDARDRRLVKDEEARLLTAMEDHSAPSGGTRRSGAYRVGSRQSLLKPLFQLVNRPGFRRHLRA